MARSKKVSGYLRAARKAAALQAKIDALAAKYLAKWEHKRDVAREDAIRRWSDLTRLQQVEALRILNEG